MVFIHNVENSNSADNNGTQKTWNKYLPCLMTEWNHWLPDWELWHVYCIQIKNQIPGHLKWNFEEKTKLKKHSVTIESTDFQKSYMAHEMYFKLKFITHQCTTFQFFKTIVVCRNLISLDKWGKLGRAARHLKLAHNEMSQCPKLTRIRYIMSVWLVTTNNGVSIRLVTKQTISSRKI